MTSSNYNWVCFDCRTVVRQAKKSNRVPVCLRCGDDCVCIGDECPVPRRENRKAWSALRVRCRTYSLATIDYLQRWNVSRKHELEREIPVMEATEESDFREKRLAELREELAQRSLC